MQTLGLEPPGFGLSGQKKVWAASLKVVWVWDTGAATSRARDTLQGEWEAGACRQPRPPPSTGS